MPIRRMMICRPFRSSFIAVEVYLGFASCVRGSRVFTHCYCFPFGFFYFHSFSHKSKLFSTFATIDNCHLLFLVGLEQRLLYCSYHFNFVILSFIIIINWANIFFLIFAMPEHFCQLELWSGAFAFYSVLNQRLLTRDKELLCYYKNINVCSWGVSKQHIASLLLKYYYIYFIYCVYTRNYLSLVRDIKYSSKK